MPTKQTTAIIGAGMAGLGAARTLKQAAHPATIFESAAQPGGRVATVHWAGRFLDSGAQNIKSEGTDFEAEISRVLKPGHITTIEAPVCLHENGKILSPDAAANAARKWSYRGGLVRLAHTLAEGLDIHYNSTITKVETRNSRFTLLDNNGDTIGDFDNLICTLPAPQAAALFHTSDADIAPERLQLLDQIEYNRCLTVLLQFETTLTADWYALLARDRSHPLLWLANENFKQQEPDRTGTSLVAQLGPTASTDLWQASDAAITHQVCNWISELLGDGFTSPLNMATQRWPYAQPRNPAAFEAINPPGSRLIFCGDALSAARIPDAYASGIRAAEVLQFARETNSRIGNVTP